MAAQVVEMGQGDTGPAYVTTLEKSDGTAQDLTGATVTFSMTRIGAKSATVSHAPVSVTDAPNGKVTYAWGATDTATAGDYNAQFTATFANGAVVSYPNNSENSLTVRVLAKVA